MGKSSSQVEPPIKHNTTSPPIPLLKAAAALLAIIVIITLGIIITVLLTTDVVFNADTDVGGAMGGLLAIGISRRLCTNGDQLEI
mmetsp:Transcript_45176/g.72657  ORF Transcript_45176/g.72657 Transcript_45176/m.72657 type:complete len:85 (+) Transcript_45176:549-803(+)